MLCSLFLPFDEFPVLFSFTLWQRDLREGLWSVEQSAVVLRTGAKVSWPWGQCPNVVLEKWTLRQVSTHGLVFVLVLIRYFVGVRVKS